MAKKGALEGIRVMDFGTWWAIPYLGVLLAVRRQGKWDS